MSTPDNPQQVSRGLLIVLGVVVGLAGLYALYAFVISPLLAEEEVPDAVATAPDDAVQGGVQDDGTGDVTTPDGGEDGTTDGVTPAPGSSDEPLLETDVVPETFEIFTARDPFQQLVVQAAAATGATGTGTGTGTGTTVTDGTVDANTGGTGTGTGTETGTGSAQRPARVRGPARVRAPGPAPVRARGREPARRIRWIRQTPRPSRVTVQARTLPQPPTSAPPTSA